MLAQALLGCICPRKLGCSRLRAASSGDPTAVRGRRRLLLLGARGLCTAGEFEHFHEGYAARRFRRFKLVRVLCFGPSRATTP